MHKSTAVHNKQTQKKKKCENATNTKRKKKHKEHKEHKERRPRMHGGRELLFHRSGNLVSAVFTTCTCTAQAETTAGLHRKKGGGTTLLVTPQATYIHTAVRRTAFDFAECNVLHNKAARSCGVYHHTESPLVSPSSPGPPLPSTAGGTPPSQRHTPTNRLGERSPCWESRGEGCALMGISGVHGSNGSTRLQGRGRGGSPLLLSAVDWLPRCSRRGGTEHRYEGSFG